MGQAGEFLVCAELARRGCVATPFAGNVPMFDVVVTDFALRTLPIQVKTVRGGAWQVSADKWLDVAFDPATRVQTVCGKLALAHPELIYVYAWLDASQPHDRCKDRFFVLTGADVQQAVHDAHAGYLASKNGVRPKKPESMHCSIYLRHLEPFEDRWDTIVDRLRPMAERQAVGPDELLVR